MVIAGILLISTFSGASLHNLNLKDSSARSCESLCLSHSQSNVIQNLFDDQEDDKKPTPPENFFATKFISLGLYGVAFSFLYLILYERKYLRMQQLRF